MHWQAVKATRETNLKPYKSKANLDSRFESRKAMRTIMCSLHQKHI